MTEHIVNVQVPDSDMGTGRPAAYYWAVCTCGERLGDTHPTWDEAYAEADAHLVTNAR